MINVENYIPMVHKLTRKQYAKFKSRYNYDDLFQAGCVGLMRAAKNFDESKGSKFSTYAYRYVEGHIINLARNDSWYVAKRVKDRTKESYAPASLDVVVGKHENTLLVELLEGDISERIDLDLQVALNKLPKILKKIILLKYIYEFTWEQVSRITKIPKGTLCKRRGEALEILRKELTA